ncbi:pyridoxal phosphate-dependent decarboxylase family protein [Candidatus Vesicomyidisocius sp. SY067_SCS001]|uniref:pyridoxal phosphate-dependent decarboxylase family protein n=1 Tax=Candidatus Vesicomyidisocius sp. SY067_SCS001 TaxID=2732590 RepID=UPI001685A4ED|nr:pyridoxal-dependent decarboxylase [Candidatus Vesicomyosocius sp. SY067_SCS001]
MQDQDVLQKITQVLATSNFKKSNQLINYQTINKLEKNLNLNKQNPQCWDEIFTWVEQYLEYSANTSHPNFANRMWSGANQPSIVGEIVTALSNTSNCTFESAPVATLMEKYMIKQMLDIVGFKNGEGQMTTGSSNANMIAMMVARNQSLKKVKKQGLFNQKYLFAFVSEDAHYSLDKASNILGIGTNHLIKVATLEDGSINTTLLNEKIKQIKQQGGLVFFVCATLGTTVRGAYDNIEALTMLKKKYNFWLHGDGAWGGAAIMSLKLKKKFLTNIESLDSFTMDFHKMLGSNLMCNFLLLNHKHLLSYTCTDGDGSYIFRDNEADLGITSLQCGRRVDSLKWFLDWKFYTRKGFSDRVENYYQLAKFAEDFINANVDLEMVLKRTSFNVCFRFKSNNNNNNNNFNQCLRDSLYQGQQALLALAYVEKKLVFRLLISNINMNKVKLVSLLNRLIKRGRALNNV